MFECLGCIAATTIHDQWYRSSISAFRLSLLLLMTTLRLGPRSRHRRCSYHRPLFQRRDSLSSCPTHHRQTVTVMSHQRSGPFQSVLCSVVASSADRIVPSCTKGTVIPKMLRENWNSTVGSIFNSILLKGMNSQALNNKLNIL